MKTNMPKAFNTTLQGYGETILSKFIRVHFTALHLVCCNCLQILGLILQITLNMVHFRTFLLSSQTYNLTYILHVKEQTLYMYDKPNENG